jgi:hypothetical protein
MYSNFGVERREKQKNMPGGKTPYNWSLMRQRQQHKTYIIA